MFILFTLIWLSLSKFSIASEGSINLTDIRFQNSDKSTVIRDYNGRNDFGYVFSIYKTSTGICSKLNEFYFEFTSLLLRIKPTCNVPAALYPITKNANNRAG